MNKNKLSRRTFTRNTPLAAAGTIAGAFAGSGCTSSNKTVTDNPLNTNPSEILNYNPQMGYRQLVKTNLIISEIVLGAHFNNCSGQHFWDKFVNNELPVEISKNRTEIVSRCIDHGINFLDITYREEALAVLP